jgi:hypothetical protein
MKFQVSYGEPNSSEEECDEVLPASKSAVQQHTTQNKHQMDWQNCSLIDRDKHPYRLLIKESIAIAQRSPILNATTRSAPLIIYPEGLVKRRIKSDTQG